VKHTDQALKVLDILGVSDDLVDGFILESKVSIHVFMLQFTEYPLIIRLDIFYPALSAAVLR
jgi:hypothetical protein